MHLLQNLLLPIIETMGEAESATASLFWAWARRQQKEKHLERHPDSIHEIFLRRLLACSSLWLGCQSAHGHGAYGRREMPDLQLRTRMSGMPSRRQVAWPPISFLQGIFPIWDSLIIRRILSGDVKTVISRDSAPKPTSPPAAGFLAAAPSSAQAQPLGWGWGNA